MLFNLLFFIKKIISNNTKISIIVDNVTIINSSANLAAFVFAKTSYLNISNILVKNSNL